MKTGTDAIGIWRVPVSIEDIDETGRHFDLAPDEKTRDEIAKVAGLRALPALSASFDVIRHGRDGLRVSGKVTAVVGQVCVVTLDPLENELHETVELVFMPSHAAPDAAVTKLGIDADEPPEILHDGIVDLGAIATEFLLLGIDPYPRKPGIVFESPKSAEPADNPFAALAALKKGADGGKE